MAKIIFPGLAILLINSCIIFFELTRADFLESKKMKTAFIIHFFCVIALILSIVSGLFSIYFSNKLSNKLFDDLSFVLAILGTFFMIPCSTLIFLNTLKKKEKLDINQG